MLNVANSFFDRCVSNMISTLREHNLTNEFMEYDPIKTQGYMFSDDDLIMRLANLVSDGHSGSSFAFCCRATKEILIEKRRHRARFKGLVRAIVVLRKLRLSAAKRTYAPPSETTTGGDGFQAAAQDFITRVTDKATLPAPLPPPPPVG